MTTIVCIVLFALLVGGAWPVAGAWQRRHAGEIYEGMAPGMTPPAGLDQPTRPITEKELQATTYAVQFHPPEGVAPRDVGLLLDRQTGPRDLAASVIALFVGGYLTLRKDEENDDWLVSVDDEPASASTGPEPSDLWLLDYFRSADGSPMRLSEAKPGLRQAFARLESDVLRSAYERGYIRRDPRGRNAPTGGLTLGAAICAALAAVLALAGSPLAWVAAGGAGALAITAGRVRGPLGRPAEGTAAYFRTMGFRRYLMTAEANQIRVEDAAGIFSRYLPWAIAFNAAEHWTGVFREVAAGIDEDIAQLWAPDLLWLALMTNMAFDGAFFAGIGEAMGDLTDTVGDFTGDLFDGGLFGDGDMFGADGGGFFGGDGGDGGGGDGGGGDGGGFFGDGGFFGGGDGGGFDFDF